jgi:hypothetical protein
MKNLSRDKSPQNSQQKSCTLTSSLPTQKLELWIQALLRTGAAPHHTWLDHHLTDLQHDSAAAYAISSRALLKHHRQFTGARKPGYGNSAKPLPADIGRFYQQQLQKLVCRDQHFVLINRPGVSAKLLSQLRQTLFWPEESGPLHFLTLGDPLRLLELCVWTPDGLLPKGKFWSALRQGTLSPLLARQVAPFWSKPLTSELAYSLFLHHVIGTHPDQSKLFKRSFGKAFPNELKQIQYIQRGLARQGKTLAQVLQDSYEELLRYKVANLLWLELGQDARVTTLHNGFLCTADISPVIRRRFTQAAIELFGYAPLLFEEILPNVCPER